MLTDHLRQVETSVLSVGYAELGPADGPAVLLLHGWPYDIHTYSEAAPILASRGHRVIVPYQRGFGTTRFLKASTLRNAQQAVLALDVVALMDALGIETATLAGADWGSRAAASVAALWPERCNGVALVSGYLISSQAAGVVPLAPKAEQSWWYQYYFATERGRRGYERHRRDFARVIWQTASPRWTFDDATFLRSAGALENPDHTAIVVHNYRWRLGLAEGDPRLDDLEARLSLAPPIVVPAISLEGDANGAPHPEPVGYLGMFTGRYEHRTVTGGVGHNLPQEAPHAFADAVTDVAGWAIQQG